MIRKAIDAAPLYQALIVQSGDTRRNSTNIVSINGTEKLPNYSKENFSIQIAKNCVRITNLYREVPVHYAWYVYKDKEPLLKQFYHESTETFQYEFTEPGEYAITAFVRVKEASKETKALQVASIKVIGTETPELQITLS